MANHYFLLVNSRNYQELTAIKLPNACKSFSKDKFYPIKVVETNGSRGRIHYIRYDNRFDEWRDLLELVDIPPPKIHDNNSANVTVHNTPTWIQPYSLYNELRIKN